jgi:phosphoglycerate dehydrogenase-like enzyme
MFVGTDALLLDSGPISLGPDGDDYFEQAVRSAGCLIAPLSADSRALVWLSYEKADDLDAVLRAHPDLSWIQLPWAGVDAFAHIIKAHSRPGRIFTSAKGAYAEPVAEHALGMLLAVMRSLPHRARLRAWESQIRGVTLHRKRITIVGGGGIARELIRILQPFDCEITIVRRSEVAVKNASATLPVARLNDVLPHTDALIVAAALTEETRGIIGAKQIKLMPEGSFLVNVARGPLVDSLAVCEMLSSGHLGGAALDVTDPEPLLFDHALWAAPNVLITPHQADTPEMTRPLLAERISRNVQAFLGNGEFIGVVDAQAGY